MRRRGPCGARRAPPPLAPPRSRLRNACRSCRSWECLSLMSFMECLSFMPFMECLSFMPPSGRWAAHGRNARARCRRGIRGGFRRWRVRPGPLAGHRRAAMIAGHAGGPRARRHALPVPSSRSWPCPRRPRPTPAGRGGTWGRGPLCTTGPRRRHANFRTQSAPPEELQERKAHAHAIGRHDRFAVRLRTVRRMRAAGRTAVDDARRRGAPPPRAAGGTL